MGERESEGDISSDFQIGNANIFSSMRITSFGIWQSITYVIWAVAESAWKFKWV